MQYYVGLDVSLKETAVCIVNGDGEIVKEGSVFSEPEDISAFLQSAAFTYERVGLETGPTSSWLYKSLLAIGLPVICIESRHANAVMKAQNVKTDKNDARGIAQIMRTGWFKAVHIKSDESQKLRVLLNNRKCLLGKRMDIDNQIRGTLKVFGLKTGKVTMNNYEARICELIEDDKELKLYIEPLLEVRRHILVQFVKLDKVVLDIVKDDTVCKRMMTIPGVGPLTALLFKATIDNPYRFKKSCNVGVHLGLTPRKYASGEIDYNGSITKCGDAMLRSHLFEAAKSMMSRSIKWSSLRVWGMKIARRSSMKNACVAVARKMAVIMHRIWVDGTEFNWGNEGKTQSVTA